MTKTLEQRCQDDQEKWSRGDTGEYCGFQIKPKHDFGPHKLQAQPGCEQLHGWIIVKNGALAVPGGGWAYSYEGALRMIAALVAAGLKEHGHRGAQDAEGADRFHALMQLTREISPDWEIGEAMRLERVASFSGAARPPKSGRNTPMVEFWGEINERLKTMNLGEIAFGPARSLYERVGSPSAFGSAQVDAGLRLLAQDILESINPES